MPISTQKARSICTASEFALYQASLRKNITALTPAVVKRDVARARNLRDKYRKLAKTQSREATGTAKPRGRRPSQSSQNTVAKAQLFDEVLERFQTRSAEIGSETRAKAKKRPPGKKTVVKKKKAAKKKAAKAPAEPSAEEILEEAEKRKAARRKAAPQPKPSRKARSKSRVDRTGLAAELALKQGRLRRSGSTRIRTHVSARGRRQQARRDARR